MRPCITASFRKTEKTDNTQKAGVCFCISRGRFWPSDCTNYIKRSRLTAMTAIPDIRPQMES